METFYVGSSRTIFFTPEAERTLRRAEKQVPPNKAACSAQLRRVLMRLADCGKLHNKLLFRHEEDGIYVAKANCGLRAYGWFQKTSNGLNAFIVGRCVMKKKKKASPADLQAIRTARDELKEF